MVEVTQYEDLTFTEQLDYDNFGRMDFWIHN